MPVSERGRRAETAAPARWGAWEWEFRVISASATSPRTQMRRKTPLGSLAVLCRSANVKRDKAVTPAPHGSVIPAFPSSSERRWGLIAGIWEVELRGDGN